MRKSAIIAAAAGAAVLLAADAALAWSWGKQEITRTITHPDGRVEVIEEKVSKSILEDREANDSFIEAARLEKEAAQEFARAFPPNLTGDQWARITEADPTTARRLAEWGDSAGDKATIIEMARALNPEITSAVHAQKEIQSLREMKGVEILKTVLGTPGGVELVRMGGSVLLGSDYNPAWSGAGNGPGIVQIDAGHSVRDGGRDGSIGGGAVGDGDTPTGAGGAAGALETGINNSPIVVTINNQSANTQAWDAGSAGLEWQHAHDGGFLNPNVAEGAEFSPNTAAPALELQAF